MAQVSVLCALSCHGDDSLVEPAFTDELVLLLSENDDDFAAECFLACLDRNSGRPSTSRFAALLSFVEKMVGEGRLKGRDIWNVVFRRMFTHAIDGGRVVALKELLGLAHDSSPSKLRQVPLNHPSLLRACLLDDYAAVKALVERGYRLKTTFLESGRQQEQQQLQQSFAEWRDLAETAFLAVGGGGSNFDQGDDIRELFVLNLMAKASYVLACYSVLAEARDLDDKIPVDVCECPQRLKGLPNSSSGDQT